MSKVKDQHLSTPEQSIGNAEKTKDKGTETQEARTITIDYKDTPLASIINEFAARRELNILLPITGIKEKVTVHLDQKISERESWTLFQTILDASDYVLIPKESMFVVVKNSKAITQETVALYINIPFKDLPETDELVRYVHYLTNIKVNDDPSSEIAVLLKEILPPVGASFLVDPVANALIITARGGDIKAAMRIISRLDQPGFEEKMEIIPLKFADCQVIAQLFNDNILKTAQQLPPYNIKQAQKSDTSYFEKETRVMPESRTNSLIVVGRAQAVDRIKDFVLNYLDVELSTGKSILHMYELQYLDAEQFVKVLSNIVAAASSEGGTGQSRAGESKGGPDRYFEGVIIRADSHGSNKLIIAARDVDWKRIKKLIEVLDIPQRQVFIEILIADLTLDDQRLLGTMLRNPDKVPIPYHTDFQAAHFPPGVLPDTFTNPSTPTAPQTVGFTHDANNNAVYTDLLRNCVDANGKKSDGGPFALTSLMAPGSTVLQINDDNKKTWGIIQMVCVFDVNKIVSNPHVMAVHNQPVEIKVGTTRLLTDEAAGNINPVVKNKEITAALNIEIKPRISSGKTVNLQIKIDIDEFIGSQASGGNARTTRNVLTNANVANGGILCIGGLNKVTDQKSASETPLLARIPIIGNFFKNKQQGKTTNSLMVFLCPTIIEPNVRNNIETYTRSHLNLAKEWSKDDVLFSDLKDPITRWFFGTKAHEKDVLEAFVNKNKLYEELDRLASKHDGKKAEDLDTKITSIVASNQAIAPESLEGQGKDRFCEDGEAFKAMLAHEESPFEKKDYVVT